MRDALRAGVAIYNDGHYHAAHDAWEDYWLDLESGTDDERLLHGLIQYTAAVYHGRNRNWEGATGLAHSAYTYLEGLPATYRAVELEPVREALSLLASDPEAIERRRPLALTHEGDCPTLADLDVGPTCVAAHVLAEALGYEESPIDTAIAYVRTDLEAGIDSSPLLALLFDFVREDDQRALVFERLEAHVSRRRSRERDVDGLFE